jgi:valyl-tRNA synthetase
MPFITEEIWQRVAPLARPGAPSPTVMLARWPHAAEFAADPEAERQIAWLREFVLGVRQIRGEMDLAPSARLDILLQGATPNDLALVAALRPWLERLAGLASIRVLEPGEAAPVSAAALLGELGVLVPLAGLIDPQAEIERLGRRIAKCESDLGKLEAKLGNESFIRNAPAEVVAGDRARQAEVARARDNYGAYLARVRRLLE